MRSHHSAVPARTSAPAPRAARREPASPADAALGRATDLLEKPRLRGWIHAGMTPLALAAGIVLIVLAPTTPTRWASAVFALTGVLLFGTSAAYHRGNWTPRTRLVLKRLDHANIALVIAGTYTPIAVTLLSPARGAVLLWVIWSLAVAGVLFRVLWVHAPRWLYVPIYVLLGLVSVLYLGEFWKVSPAITILIAVGGAAYIVGAVCYGFKRPKLSRDWFGFHEVFHVLTVVGFTCHFVGITMAVLAAR
ncbi:hemolysin III [Tersicoccus phoenicis]|uniref:Hemolysin III n=1 Tax=Tersicoccus phoenicis TaxID=554083 RepID=A0A1R1L8F7_9MICC|nr:hemolysin III family protein [Tersicoccus phoenicis]OMH23803.1 hemolysin III [Tersicoccus phoenicis]